eukprot:TRINITY_DN1318_c0_g1_i1.p2 TRINITY_DN1318_c0_g1~~TRINITY_DN1318_c0_g1_i1.p2  ORF type:complete len:489 (-),score=133.05 TRINITY_DN1318_c0_g1_i1:1033-2478(-)
MRALATVVGSLVVVFLFLEALGTADAAKPAEEQQRGKVVELTHRNFDKVVMDKKKHVLVKFYAPWCGHCKKLAPVYEQVAEAFQGEPSVVLAKIDASEERTFSERFNIRGFPTLRWFPKEKHMDREYDGGREAEDLISFINEETGLQRALGGGFNSKAGRIPYLDELAQQFVVNSEKRDRIELEAIGFVEGLGKRERSGGAYLEAMKMIREKGLAWLAAERCRLEETLLEKRGAVAKVFRFKLNIFNSFSSKGNLEDFDLFPSAVVSLTQATLNTLANDVTTHRLVEFYAPWCGHCKALAPTYEKLAQHYASNDEVVIAKIDATSAREISEQFGVKGFPTIKFFPKGSTEPEEYENGRSGEDFVDYLNSKTGSTVEFTEDTTAGRLSEMDVLVEEFMNGPTKEERGEALLLAEEFSQEYADEDAWATGWYLHYMRKALEMGEIALQHEKDSLSELIKNPTTKAAKAALFQRRRNILDAFKK